MVVLNLCFLRLRFSFFRIWDSFIYPGEEYRGLPVIDFDVVVVVGGVVVVVGGVD